MKFQKTNKKAEMQWSTIIGIIAILITFLVILGIWYQFKTLGGLIVDNAACSADTAKIIYSQNNGFIGSVIKTTLLKTSVTPACISSSIYIKQKDSSDSSYEETFLKNLDETIKSCNNTFLRLKQMNKFNVRCATFYLSNTLSRTEIEKINLKKYPHINNDIINSMFLNIENAKKKSETTTNSEPSFTDNFVSQLVGPTIKTNTKLSDNFYDANTLIITMKLPGKIEIDSIGSYYDNYKTNIDPGYIISTYAVDIG